MTNGVTCILNAIEQGDPHAAGQLLPLVYEELCRLAARKMAHEPAGQTLNATALVHEAYLRLVGGGDDRRWDSRGHFLPQRPRRCGASSSKTHVASAARNVVASSRAANCRTMMRSSNRKITKNYFLVNPQNHRTTWSYDAADRVKVQYLGNSTRASYTYDDANRLLKLANIRSDATTISSFDYAYDSVGNRTRVIESDGIRVTWSYDNKYELTRERRNGGNAYDITYSYDAAGNRRVKLEDAIRTTYAYDAANQLRYHEDNTGRTTYTFDANGNQRIVKVPSGGLTTNTWDDENKLTKVILTSGTRNTFSYDTDGRRVKKEDSSGNSKFVWDAENILVETDSSDVIQVVYCQEPNVYGNLISQYRSATTSFFHFDALGSTDRLTSSLGIVTDNYLYKAFGIIAMSSGTTINAFRFVGRNGYSFQADLDQVHVRARYYDPPTGRFEACDLTGPHACAYLYANNDPVNWIDPAGADATRAFAMASTLVTVIDNARVQACMDAFPVPSNPNWPIAKPPKLSCFAGCLAGKVDDPSKQADCILNCVFDIASRKPDQFLREWVAAVVCCNTYKSPGFSGQVIPNPCDCKPDPSKPKGVMKCVQPGKDPFRGRQEKCFACCAFIACTAVYSKLWKLKLWDFVEASFKVGDCQKCCAAQE